jgi:putative membrane-bound dehydrogenase-like protein
MFNNKKYNLLLLCGLILLLNFCKNKKVEKPLLSDEQKHQAKNTLYNIKVADSLELKTFATEPMLINPTNIDVDTRGRVWVCEAYNYRPTVNGNPTKPEGDRIVILEDNNNDGKADTSKVYYQGPELNAPLGIAILGNKVYVSQSPYIWVFTDENGDDKADKKEILFQGIKGIQHDHGVHAITFGPDGKLYFNMGNEGKTLRDRNNKPIITKDGLPLNDKNYREGLTIRCDLDGSNVEVIGQNFRNSYEPALDSYGNIWLSDNDDDGNQATRLNYLLQYGNYGYSDHATGASWRQNRVNVEKEIPLQHWHLNDPGVVPNLLQTKAGSPTGMLFYEGSLLPQVFRNRLIHCEPGSNVVRAYQTTNSGAGFTASILNIAKDSVDQWFRPSDVCAAPDGSLFIADWYDPGVGGHEAGDQAKGRIYRLAPVGHKLQIPNADLSSVAGAIDGLQSPSQAVRFVAYQNLKKFGDQAIPSLQKLLTTASNPNIAARAFWLLAQSSQGHIFIEKNLKHPNPNFRIAAIRAAVLYGHDVLPMVKSLLPDTSAQVRRECALALRANTSPEATQLWVQLANKHNGADRWYLEALGIATHKQEDAFMKAYLLQNPNLNIQNLSQADIIWRIQSNLALPYLTQLATNERVSLPNRLRYFRAFDFLQGIQKDDVLLKIITESKSTAMTIVALSVANTQKVKRSALAMANLEKALNTMPDSSEDYISLIDRYSAKSQIDRLLKSTESMSGPGQGMQSARSLLRLGQSDVLFAKIKEKHDTIKANMMHTMRWIGSEQSVSLLQKIALDKTFSEFIRKTAFLYMPNSTQGEIISLAMLEKGAVPKEYVPAIVEGLSNSWKKIIREQARKYLGPAKTSDGKQLPTIAALTRMSGSAEKGKVIFKNYCSTCHQIDGVGLDFGPNLSVIGAKLTAESILSSIIHPDLGISFGYEGWELTLADGSTMAGIIASKTETDIILKQPGGNSQTIKTSQIKNMKKIDGSIMPAGLQEAMTTKELVDLTIYLRALGR